MVANLYQVYIWQGMNNQNKQGTQKTNLQKHQWHNEEMGKLMEQNFFKRTIPNGQKTHEEMFNIHKGSINQNHIKFPYYSYLSTIIKNTNKNKC
jgi:hypothetical protein